MTVVARPRSFFTFEFDLLEDGRPAGRIRHRLFGRGGQIWVDGFTYTIARTGPVRWEVSQEGVPGAVVTAERPGLLRTRYDIRWDRDAISIVRVGLGYRVNLVRRDGKVGEIRLRNLFTRTLLAEFPDDVPPVVRAFLLWMVVRIRRAAAGAASGGG